MMVISTWTSLFQWLLKYLSDWKHLVTFILGSAFYYSVICHLIPKTYSNTEFLENFKIHNIFEIRLKGWKFNLKILSSSIRNGNYEISASRVKTCRPCFKIKSCLLVAYKFEEPRDQCQSVKC